MFDWKKNSDDIFVSLRSVDKCAFLPINKRGVTSPIIRANYSVKITKIQELTGIRAHWGPRPHASEKKIPPPPHNQNF